MPSANRAPRRSLIAHAALTAWAACLVLAWAPAPRAASADAATAPTVVLLHGLNRTHRSMARLADALRASGRRVVNLDYPSSTLRVADLALWLAARLQRCCAGPVAARIDFVTHSLGGIVLRALRRRDSALGMGPAIAIGRVVMLSPPNRGSELVDVLAGSAAFRLLTGPAGQELGTGVNSVPNRLGEVDFELGVVAGCSSLNPVHSWIIPGIDDGTVAVARTRVQGMRDVVTVRASHSFIMQDAEAIRQTLLFLQEGRFDHTPQSAPCG